VYPIGALRTRDYFAAGSARLIVEVGVATATSDRTVKLGGYAAGSVAELWLVAPEEATLSCYREPVDGRYQDVWELPWPGGLPEAVARLVARLG